MLLTFQAAVTIYLERFIKMSLPDEKNIQSKISRLIGFFRHSFSKFAYLQYLSWIYILIMCLESIAKTKKQYIVKICGYTKYEYRYDFNDISKEIL